VSLYVSDTHALLWYLGGAAHLSADARAEFDGAGRRGNQIIVPAIVVAETLMLVEKGRIALDASQILARLQAHAGFVLTPLVPETVFVIKNLTALPDIHDRLIVAEAIVRQATLITRDAAIRASGLVATLW
jgi:PIN domain nuclease of toxin-antitoxin system